MNQHPYQPNYRLGLGLLLFAFTVLLIFSAVTNYGAH